MRRRRKRIELNPSADAGGWWCLTVYLWEPYRFFADWLFSESVKSTQCSSSDEPNVLHIHPSIHPHTGQVKEDTQFPLRGCFLVCLVFFFRKDLQQSTKYALSGFNGRICKQTQQALDRITEWVSGLQLNNNGKDFKYRSERICYLTSILFYLF